MVIRRGLKRVVDGHWQVGELLLLTAHVDLPDSCFLDILISFFVQLLDRRPVSASVLVSFTLRN